ncbi:MAG: membrane protein insertase YidC [Phycisphaerales bacterium]
MTPGLRRTLITFVVSLAAIGVIAVVASQGRHGNTPAGSTPTNGATPTTSPATAPAATPKTAPASASTAPDTAVPAADPASASNTAYSTGFVDAAAPGASAGPEPQAGANGTNGADDANVAAPQIGALPPADVASWRAVAPHGGLAGQPPAPLGSLDPRTAKLFVEFAPRGAGLSRIVLADYWETAAARRVAAAHWRAVERGASSPPPLPDDSLRYVLQTSLPLGNIDVPLLAVHSIEIDDTLISLFGDVWSCTAPGEFVTEVRDGDGKPMLRVHRRLALGGDGYDIQLTQSIENLSGRDLGLRWIQYGPPDLRVEAHDTIDPRRFHFGYLMGKDRDPSQSIVSAQGQLTDHGAVVKAIQRGEPKLWPNRDSIEGKLALSWFGTTSRYFACAVHAPYSADNPSLSVAPTIEVVSGIVGGATPAAPQLLTELYSPLRTIPAGGTASFDVGVYAGPLDPRILGAVQPYEALGMSGLIVYLMSTTGCCNFCTFPILARVLLVFLSFLHDYVVFDWALAIIVLVLIVRAILHPITRRSQIAMMRTTRGAAELKPEMEKLQQRFKDDPKRLQQETMRLYREKGVNPVGCVSGLLPTFLQMPIWIALYAMLYFAIELRQQPAFFGVFQLFGGWQFLGDLSASDHFLVAFDKPRQFLFFKLTGINLIPILMGLVFFFQQKYMTPPTTVKLTPEQEQQQKITKWMVVVMFPLMMYSAPSGLTLYMLTSSIVGIIESKLIRSHMREMDLRPPAPRTKKKQDTLGRMYEEAMKRAAERQQQKKYPPRKFKERE